MTSGQHGVQQKQQQQKQQQKKSYVNDLLQQKQHLHKPVQDGGQHNQNKQKQNKTKDGGRTLAGDGGHELEAKAPKEEARTNTTKAKIKNRNKMRGWSIAHAGMPASRLARLPSQEGGEPLSGEGPSQELAVKEMEARTTNKHNT